MLVGSILSFLFAVLSRPTPQYVYHYQPGLMKTVLLNNKFDKRLLYAPVAGFASTRDVTCSHVQPNAPQVVGLKIDNQWGYYLVVDCTARKDNNHQKYVLHLEAEVDAQTAQRHDFYWNGYKCESTWCGHKPVVVGNYMLLSEYLKDKK